MPQSSILVKQLVSNGVIKGPPWWMCQKSRLVLFVLAVVFVFVLALVYQLQIVNAVSISLPDGASVATALTAFVASIFAFAQWLDARNEASIDKLYDRSDLVNSRYYAWPEVRKLVGHFWPETKDESGFREVMYVYLELDNLEYIIYRFELGFASLDTLERAINTFASRCLSERFADMACAQVRSAGYRDNTKSVVDAVATATRG